MATFLMTDSGLQCKIDTIVTAKKDSIKTKGQADSAKSGKK